MCFLPPQRKFAVCQLTLRVSSDIFFHSVLYFTVWKTCNKLLCIKRLLFYAWDSTLAALVRLNFPLVRKAVVYTHVA
jgi:hypothetical protein